MKQARYWLQCAFLVAVNAALGGIGAWAAWLLVKAAS